MLKTLLEHDGVIVAPGVYDGLSSLLAKHLGFKVIYMGGYAIAASRYGLPDAGLVGLAEMVDAIRMIHRTNDSPLMADADTGYGGLINIKHTVRTYESEGVTAIQIEDQEMPKKCGHTPGKRVVSRKEANARIEVASNSRRADNMWVIARTDSFATHGIEEAIDRCKDFKKAGADVLMIDAPGSLQELKRIGDELHDSVLLLNMTPQKGFVTPHVTNAEAKAMGFSIIIYPGLFAYPALGAMERNGLDLLANDIVTNEQPPMVSIHALVGFPEIWADEKKWSVLYAE